MKFFRIALSGATTDNREITPEQINQMAANYNKDKYQARIWLEHFRSLFPDGIFSALGDVLELKAEDGPDGKRALMARLSPTANLVKMNQNKQKVFTSIEMDPSFSDTNEAYLVGLAVTDSPASLGTEMLQFCDQNRAKFNRGGDLPTTVISDGLDVGKIDFSAEKEADKSTLFSKITDMLGKSDKVNQKAFADMQKSVLELASAVSEIQGFSSEAPATGGTGAAQEFKTLQEKNAALETKVSDLQKLAAQPAGTYRARPLSDGTGEHQVTDC